MPGVITTTIVMIAMAMMPTTIIPVMAITVSGACYNA
jgi:hypothetical protein